MMSDNDFYLKVSESEYGGLVVYMTLTKFRAVCREKARPGEESKFSAVRAVRALAVGESTTASITYSGTAMRVERVAELPASGDTAVYVVPDASVLESAETRLVSCGKVLADAEEAAHEAIRRRDMARMEHEHARRVVDEINRLRQRAETGEQTAERMRQTLVEDVERAVLRARLAEMDEESDK